MRSAPDPALLEALDGAVEEPLDDLGVVPGRDDGDVLVGGPALDRMAAVGQRERSRPGVAHVSSSLRPWWRMVWPIRSRFVRR